MSSIEIIVIIFGLLIGYWIVSKSISGGSKKNQSFTSGDERTNNSSGSYSSQEKQSTESESTNESGSTSKENHSKDSALAWNEVLNVSSQASTAELKKAYKVLMSQYHPDKVAALGEELRDLAERKSKEITVAYREAMRCRGIDA